MPKVAVVCATLFALASVALASKSQAQSIHLSPNDGQTATLDGLSGHCVLVVGTRRVEDQEGLILRGMLRGFGSSGVTDLVGDAHTGPTKFVYWPTNGQNLIITMYKEYHGVQTSIGMTSKHFVLTPYNAWTLTSISGVHDVYTLDVYDYPGPDFSSCHT